MSSGSGLELGRLVVGSLGMAVAHGCDLDLPRLDLLSLRDRQPEHAVLERRRSLVGLEAGRQRHRAAEGAAPDLLDEVRALIARALARGLAADRHRAVLDGDVDVLGAHAWQR